MSHCSLQVDNYVSHSSDEDESQEDEKSELSPLIISVTHGGYDAIVGAPKRTSGVLDGDQFTRELSLAMLEECNGYIVICESQRLFVDCNRGRLQEQTLAAAVAPPERYMSDTAPVEPSVTENPAQSVYDRFHKVIANRIAKVAASGQTALLLDVHGNSFKRLKGLVYVTGCLTQSTGGQPIRSELCAMLQAEGVPTNTEEREKGDGVFTGGFVTHHYGREVANCFALQLEVHVDFRVDAECARECGRKIGRAVAKFLQSFKQQQKSQLA
jgi:N-formylglutamate amidohydrolase